LLTRGNKVLSRKLGRCWRALERAASARLGDAMIARYCNRDSGAQRQSSPNRILRCLAAAAERLPARA
jgi:hypothetical protein